MAELARRSRTHRTGCSASASRLRFECVPGQCVQRLGEPKGVAITREPKQECEENEDDRVYDNDVRGTKLLLPLQRSGDARHRHLTLALIGRGRSAFGC